MKSGEVSRAILAGSKLRGMSDAFAERKTEVAKVLVGLLTNENINVSIGASVALPEWATPEVIPELEAALDNTNALSRNQVFQTLKDMKDPAVIPVLARRLTDQRDRVGAGSALARRGEAAESEVLKYAQHDDRSVRMQVVNILRRIGTKRSVPVLQKMAQSDPDRGVQVSAQSILRRLNVGR